MSKTPGPVSLTPEVIRETAMKALVDVASNPKAPPAARAAAGRTLLEAAGVIGRLQDVARLNDKRSMAEMTESEVSDEIRRLAGKVRKTAKPTIDLDDESPF